MSNGLLPRAIVHEWSEAIGADQASHASSLNRLLKDQRRLSRFVEENRGSLQPAASGVAMYLVGVVLRIFDMAGGRLRKANWSQIREASGRVQQAAVAALPFDEGFADRIREVSWRAQPHILDEAIMALFDREPNEDEDIDLANEEALKIFLLMWVVTEALDANWSPPKNLALDSEYAYVHIEPSTDEDEADEADEAAPAE